MKKERKEVQLSTSMISFVNQYKQSNGLSNFSAALESIIRSYQEQVNNSSYDDLIKLLDEHYKNLFTRIRLGSNAADINSQVILEVLNAIVYELQVKPLTTNVKETETINVSRKEVKDRIAYYKQLKDNKVKK